MSIFLNDYTYELPPDRIALYPLKERDQSKLLFYRDGQISHYIFDRLPDLLPPNSFLFFNDTKVIPARLIFQKETGAEIEIFLLNPLAPSPLLTKAMVARESCVWECTVGNMKRWKNDVVLLREVDGIRMEARLKDRNKGYVQFSWNSHLTFSELIMRFGDTPLPPYLHRKAESSDRERYQTVYSRYEGAVAAPTAGLHFTNRTMDALVARGFGYDFLTLHVSAGTFQPLKVERAEEHVMHEERIVVTRKNLDPLLNETNFIVPVGTTSMRTLESLYWYGVKLLGNPESEFVVSQHDPYLETDSLPTRHNAIKAVIGFMERNNLKLVHGNTSIYIRPGYSFRVCNGLITNFHQPGSTLLLLVAAFIGGDWKKVYDEALLHDYRFLSYGDSSLLIPSSH
ncbi:MAG TPA: S-adenosylmethionine:tRNA ribosyltransferase-isomerase [Cyclobacteriaceae bacterium]|nr:S-adenosylmethionine:tRNA ribosyltransferase-isomerase [Cyclobacteriaceae bacterium]